MDIVTMISCYGVVENQLHHAAVYACGASPWLVSSYSSTFTTKFLQEVPCSPLIKCSMDMQEEFPGEGPESTQGVSVCS